ncbi:hypothetical protein FXO37_06204 [Capsicum annuum]|nr:hypothetical protein FXO37_06204 [Capsicum annuum]
MASKGRGNGRRKKGPDNLLAGPCTSTSPSVDSVAASNATTVDSQILKFKEVVEYAGNGRLIIAPDGNGFIPVYNGGHMVINVIKPFYMESWTKSAWNSCHNNEIQHIFKLKTALRIKEHLYEAWRNLEKSGWLNANEKFQKNIEEWRQTQPTSEDGTMVQPSPVELNSIWTTVVSGPKKGRIHGTGVLQSSSSPSLFPSCFSSLQAMEEMEAMKKQIMELTQKCATNDAKFAKFNKLEELVKKHMSQVFHDKKDNEFGDN